MSSSGTRTLGIVLLVVGIILLAVGIVYLTVPINSLPSFLGHAARAGHHTKRGWAGLLLGVVLLILGGVTLSRARSTSS
jgi:Zn-dependent protease